MRTRGLQQYSRGCEVSWERGTRTLSHRLNLCFICFFLQFLSITKLPVQFLKLQKLQLFILVCGVSHFGRIEAGGKDIYKIKAYKSKSVRPTEKGEKETKNRRRKKKKT